MTTLATETVLSVHHWNDTLFSFRTTRDQGLRFTSGQFVMVGLEVAGRPLTRAYSIASASHDEHLEFFSIKVADGPLTSRLQHLQPGDPIIVSKKPTGTLVLRDLKPGKRLFMFATGTGLAPFMSVQLYSSECGVAKPHPEIFRRALDALRLPDEEVTFVGDRLGADVGGAQAAGMKGVLVEVGHRVETHAGIVPDARICELTELLTALPGLFAIEYQR